jgi:hypothetical protein
LGFHRERERDWLSNENLALVKGIKKKTKKKTKEEKNKKKSRETVT